MPDSFDFEKRLQDLEARLRFFETISKPTLSTYSPTWTSTGTQPALGDGTLTGSYIKINSTITVWVTLTMGSTTTFGTGVYEFSLPATMAATPAFVAGVATMQDTGTNNYAGIAKLAQSNNQIRIQTTASPSVSIGAAAPHTWANTDVLAITVSYMV